MDRGCRHRLKSLCFSRSQEDAKGSAEAGDQVKTWTGSKEGGWEDVQEILQFAEEKSLICIYVLVGRIISWGGILFFSSTFDK